MSPKGFILIEASMAYIVLSLALLTLLPVFVLSIRASQRSRQVSTAMHLSQELLEEVRLRRWDQMTPSPPESIATGSALGVDGGEAPLDKRTFNDVDDFNAWSESPPLGPLMNPLPAELAGFTRSVSVQYLTMSLAPTAGPTDRKLVSVCTSRPQLNPVCLQTIVTNR